MLASGVPSVSFEVFPPKKDAPFAPVRRAVARLAKEKPSFISVTYGAGGGANANTASVAEFVERGCGTTALAHLTCVLATEDDIRAQVKAIRAAGVSNILAPISWSSPTMFRPFASAISYTSVVSCGLPT